MKLNLIIFLALIALISCNSSEHDSGSFLYELDPETGEVLWSFESTDVTSGALIYQDKLIFGSDSLLQCFERKSHRPLWTFTTNGWLTMAPKVQNGWIYIFTDDGIISCISLDDGIMKWQFDTRCMEQFGFALCPDYFGTTNGYLFASYLDESTVALDCKTGNVIWRSNAKCLISETITLDSSVVIPTLEGLCSVNLRNGSLIWSNKIGCTPASSPAFYHSKSNIILSTLDKRVILVNARTGDILNEITKSENIVSTPSITQNEIIFGCNDGFIYSYTSDLKSLNWKFKTTHQIHYKPLIHGDKVYFGSSNGVFYCLNLNNGKVLWELKTNGPLDLTMNATLADKLFIGSTNGFIVDMNVVEENLFENYRAR